MHQLILALTLSMVSIVEAYSAIELLGILQRKNYNERIYLSWGSWRSAKIQL